MIKNISLNKVLFWAGVASAIVGAITGSDAHNALVGILVGISFGIAALAFLKASELLNAKSV